MKKIWKQYHFSILLCFSILIGSTLGICLKERANVLKPIGEIYLNMMFTIVVPLVFTTIASSVSNMLNLKRLGKILKTMLMVFFITSFIAAILMLFAVKQIDPAKNVSLTFENSTVEEISIGEKIVETLTVSDFGDLLSRNHMLPLILFSILFGIGVSLLKEKGKLLGEVLSISSEAMMKCVKIIMWYAPIGLCAYFASLVGEFGPTLIGSYARSFLLYSLVGIFYYFIFYTFYAFLSAGKEGVFLFYKHILNPTVTAFATQSSLATLPTNLECAKEIGIPKDIREVSISIGSTMNMHGSVLGAILKIAFLFSIFGKSFTGFDTYLIALFISVLSGVVMSGIPGGGLIGEMLIVSLYNFPSSAFFIISTIGIIIDAPATLLNVVGNIPSSMLITRFIEGKNWFKRKEI